MRKNTLKCSLALIFALLLTPFNALAQDMMFEVPLARQVELSTQIVEGKVIATQSFWDAKQENIYTINTVEVYKVFKGQSVSTLDIITPGGSVGLQIQVTTPSLQLAKNDIGIFMLKSSDIDLTETNSNLRFKPYSGPQGFYKYNLIDNLAANPFSRVNNIEAELYSKIIEHTGVNFVRSTDYNVSSHIQNIDAARGTVNITSFTPTTTTAGTKSTITINGAGFGATAGQVGFRDANDGGATYVDVLATQIISWSDTQIVAEVASRAGTGTIRVTTSGADVGESGGTLTISYAQINATANVGNGTEAFQTQHANRNGNGGYVWNMHTDFDANTAANEAFMRAFDTWRCETDIYWEIGATTAIDVVALDGTNIIRFDNASELPDGVLGVNTSYFDGCIVGGTTVVIFINELDIVFNDAFTGPLAGFTWQFGPAAPSGTQFDFESVAVHELGHGHQLAHVIDNTVVMNYALFNGQSERSLSTGDINGANDVQSRSTGSASCAFPAMSSFDCSTLGNEDFVLTDNISVFPNPTTDVIYVKNTAFINVKNIALYDINGRLITNSSHSISSGQHELDVRNLSNGLYFITIQTSNGALTKKIVIQ